MEYLSALACVWSSIERLRWESTMRFPMRKETNAGCAVSGTDVAHPQGRRLASSGLSRLAFGNERPRASEFKIGYGNFALLSPRALLTGSWAQGFGINTACSEVGLQPILVPAYGATLQSATSWELTEEHLLWNTQIWHYDHVTNPPELSLEENCFNASGATGNQIDGVTLEVQNGVRLNYTTEIDYGQRDFCSYTQLYR